MLHKFTKEIITKNTIDEAFIALQHYTFFINYLKSQFRQREMEPLLTFLMRDIVHNILHITNQTKHDDLCAAAIRLLIQFTKTCVKYPNFKPYFHLIVNSLTPLSNKYKSDIIKLLNLLIIENKEQFVDCIPLLESFSRDEPEFQQFQNTYNAVKYSKSKGLRHEICYFLKIDHEARLESLIGLQKHLASNKLELRKLYDELKENRGYGLEHRNNLIYQLIGALMKLFSSSNQDVRSTFII